MVWKDLWTISRGHRGSSERGPGVASACPGLSPIIRFLCDLSYWCVWKLLRWAEPRLWPLKLLGGQSISRHQLSPSASVSHQSPNLFGKQMTLLSLVSGGLLRVRSSLFSYWGRLGWSKENRRVRVSAGVQCGFMTDCYMTFEGVRALLHTNICVYYTAQPLLLLLLWCCQVEFADRCWTGLNEILMSESSVDWVYHSVSFTTKQR